MQINFPDYLKTNKDFERQTIKNSIAKHCHESDKHFASTILNRSLVQDTIKSIQAIHKKLIRKKRLVHVGTGGSSLGAKMLVRSLKKECGKSFYFLDSLDPESIMTIENYDPRETLFFIASKSGETTETIATLAFILKNFKSKNFPQDQWPESILVCTDSTLKSDLVKIAKEMNLSVFNIPSKVCGRYGLFTPLGLLPAQFAHISLPALLKGAGDFLSHLPTSSVAGLAQAIVHNYRHQGIDQIVIMPYCDRLESYAPWFAQLWAESLGKNGLGLTPILASGPQSQHSLMQLFLDGPKNKFLIIIKVEHFRKNSPPLDSAHLFPSLGELESCDLTILTHQQITKVSKTLQTFKIPYALITLEQLEEYELGALISLSALLTILVGDCLGINLFTQPIVDLVKRSPSPAIQKSS